MTGKLSLLFKMQHSSQGEICDHRSEISNKILIW